MSAKNRREKQKDKKTKEGSQAIYPHDVWNKNLAVQWKKLYRSSIKKGKGGTSQVVQW